MVPTSCAPLMLVNPPPLPLKVPVIFTPLAPLVTMVVGNCAGEIVPVTLLAVFANIAKGVGRIGSRGVNSVNVAPPLVRTAISIQLLDPLNTSGPKSITVANMPLVTPIARLVTGPARGVPFVFVA